MSFTAPVSGLYNFSTGVEVSGLDNSGLTGGWAAYAIDADYDGPGRTLFWSGNPYAASGGGFAWLTLSGSADIYVTAGQIVDVHVWMTGAEAKPVNVVGNAAIPDTYFAGHLVK